MGSALLTAAVALQPDQKVVDIYVTVHLRNVFQRYPAHLVHFRGVLHIRRQLLFDFIEEVLADRELVIRYRDSPSNVHTCLFKRLTLCALDVGLAAVLVAFGKGPFARSPTTDKQDCILWSDTNAAVYFVIEWLVAAE